MFFHIKIRILDLTFLLRNLLSFRFSVDLIVIEVFASFLSDTTIPSCVFSYENKTFGAHIVFKNLVFVSVFDRFERNRGVCEFSQRHYNIFL